VRLDANGFDFTAPKKDVREYPNAGAPDKPGDRRSGFDFSYRLPKLRNWLTFYGDGFTDDEISPLGYVDRSAWLAHISDMKGEVAVRDIKNLPDDGHLYAAHVINDIWRITGGNAIVVTDVGQHQMWEAQYYHHETPRSLITSGGLGTMGFALPAAIGTKVGKPDAEVWVVVGDGGFQMTLCELATMVQEDLDVKICIINNGYLGMVRQWQEFFYQRRYAATPITGPEFAKLAAAYGVWGATVTARSEVEPTVEIARRQKGALIDFRVEQEDSVFPMVPAGADLHKMIRRPSPIVETSAD